MINVEYRETTMLLYSEIIHLRWTDSFLYNWRSDGIHHYVHNPKKYGVVAKVPSRYFYSNTKEQLKSLYF